MVILGNVAFVGQVIIGLFFVIAGVNQFFNLAQMKAYAGAKGVPAVDVVIPVVAFGLATAGIGILIDPFVGLDTLTYGVVIGVISTVGITIVMHDFWGFPEQDGPVMTVTGSEGEEATALPPMDNEIFHFLKNLALVGGILLLLQ